MRDLIFRNHGSIWLMVPVTEAGTAWIDEHVRNEETLTWGGAIVVEPRYVESLVENAKADGLTV